MNSERKETARKRPTDTERRRGRRPFNSLSLFLVVLLDSLHEFCVFVSVTLFHDKECKKKRRFYSISLYFPRVLSSVKTVQETDSENESLWGFPGFLSDILCGLTLFWLKQGIPREEGWSELTATVTEPTFIRFSYFTQSLGRGKMNCTQSVRRQWGSVLHSKESREEIFRTKTRWVLDLQ